MKLAATLIPILALPASALGPLVNGDFENQSGSGEVQSTDAWFEFSAAGYDDWVNVAPHNAPQFPPGQGNTFNMSTDSGFIYQTIGIRGDGDLGLRVGGTAVFRHPLAPREFRAFRISVYQTDAGATGADGTHPSALPGGEVLDSRVFTRSDLGFAELHVSPEAKPFSVDLSLGNATTGRRLWLAIDAMPGLHETGLDDLAVTPLATDPGPATGPAVPRVMLVGDSFWERDEMRQMIHDSLNTAGEEFDFVGSRTSAVTDPENEGLASKQFIHVLNGRSTPASRVSAPIGTLLPVYQPDIVALQIGTNDLWYNFQDSSGTEFHENVGRSPEQMIGDMRLVARAIHAHDPATRIIVTTVTPITVPNPHIGGLAEDFNVLAADYNSRLRTVVPGMRSLGIHISLSDGHQAWGGDATGKVSDGLHPNTAGNQLLADSWVAAIRGALEVFDGAVHYDTTQFIDPGDSETRIIEKASRLLPSQKQVDWQRLENTFFIHFGPNTFTGVEWGSGFESPADFQPTAFDAGQWVEVIKSAGGNMLMLVVKHHDGFCLFPSRYTGHDVASSPWLGGNGDVVRAVSDACAAAGIRFGIYLSPADLYQIESAPGFGSGMYGNGSAAVLSTIPTDPARFGSDPAQGRTPPAGFGSHQFTVDDYNRYFLNQLYELLTEYGPVTEVWFDGANPKQTDPPQQYDRQAWFELINRLQPAATIAIKGPDIRWVGNEHGYARETEWSCMPIPQSPGSFDWIDATATDIGSRARLVPGSFLHWWPAEADVPILSGWFWTPSRSVKSTGELLDIYHASVGRNANLLLNLSPDTRGLIPDNQIRPLMEAMNVVRQTYATDLAAAGTIAADSSLAGFPASNVLDGNLDSHWEPAAGVTTPTLTLTLPAATTIDRVVLQEAIAVRGQRIESFAVDTWSGTGWQQRGAATTVGHKRIVRIPETTTDKLRIRITASRTEPTLAAVSLHRSVPMLVPPVIAARAADGTVAITAEAGNIIHYTLDGTDPGTGSPVYQNPLPLELGGTVRAISRVGGAVSFAATRAFAGVAPIGWQVVDVDSEQAPGEAAALAIDDDPATLWHSAWVSGTKPHPHHITIDMGTARWIRGFTYLPRANALAGTVKNFRFEVSLDNLAWNEVAAGAFDNIRNNPVQQIITFGSDVRARYFRFTALDEVNGSDHTSAAEISVLPGGFDGFKRESGLHSSHDNDDGDDDGVGLLLEYYFGLDPTLPDSVRKTSFGSEASEGVMEVTRRSQVPDLSVGLESSSDLISWEDPQILGRTTEEIGGGLSLDRYRFAKDENPLFLRLRIAF